MGIPPSDLRAVGADQNHSDFAPSPPLLPPAPVPLKVGVAAVPSQVPGSPHPSHQATIKSTMTCEPPSLTPLPKTSCRELLLHASAHSDPGRGGSRSVKIRNRKKSHRLKPLVMKFCLGFCGAPSGPSRRSAGACAARGESERARCPPQQRPEVGARLGLRCELAEAARTT